MYLHTNAVGLRQVQLGLVAGHHWRAVPSANLVIADEELQVLGDRLETVNTTVWGGRQQVVMWEDGGGTVAESPLPVSPCRFPKPYEQETH